MAIHKIGLVVVGAVIGAGAALVLVTAALALVDFAAGQLAAVRLLLLLFL